MDQDKGVRSSEFWTKNLVQLAVGVGALTGHGVTEQQAVYIVAALEGAYMGARALKKAIKQLAHVVAAWKSGEVSP